MSTALEQEQSEQRTLERVLRHLLPPQVIPFAHPRNHTLAMYGGIDSPQNAIEVLTANEWKVLVALAESYPYYSPYEALLAGLTSLSVERSRALLQAAHQHGTLRQELRPLRDVIKTLRRKLRSFSLAVVSLNRLGSQLTVGVPSHASKEVTG